MVDLIKTYPELGAATDVADGDLLASYRSSGPLKKLPAATLRNYLGLTFADQDGSNISGGDKLAFLDSIGAAAEVVVGPNVASGVSSGSPTTDLTAAFDATIVTGGARPHFPQGDWYGNFQTSETNVVIVGQGGDSEAAGGGGEVLRPFNTALPTVQFGGDGVLSFGNGVRDLAISGLKGAVNAPAALLLAGGVANSFSSHFTLTDGVKSLSLEPSDDQPVTCAFFDNFHIRNGTNVPESRAVYMRRPADVDEYLTSISFSNGHINGPTDGYVMEIDGSGNGIAASFVNTYIDFEPDHHVLIKGSSLLLGFNLQIDPDQLDTVVVETDGSSLDPTTVLAGLVRVEGNKFRNGLAQEHTFASDWFMRNPYVTDMLFYGQLNFTTLANRARTTHYLAMVSDSGPLGVYGMDFSARATTASTTTATGSITTLGGLGVAKSVNAGEDFTAGSGTGGATGYGAGRVDTGGNLRLLPGGSLLFGGSAIGPDGNTPNVTLGAAGNPFARSYTTQATIGSSATTSPSIFSGSATPEGAVTAPPGSIYLRTGGGAATSFYVKESGTGNTGWVAK